MSYEFYIIDWIKSQKLFSKKEEGSWAANEIRYAAAEQC